MYFSDFCLRGEEKIFDFLNLGIYDVAGLGYGAYEAFCYTYQRVLHGYRVQKLVLIAPFFDSKTYLHEVKKIYKNHIRFAEFLIQEKALESPDWRETDLKILQDCGVELEVYIGGKSPIGESEKVLEFFRKFGTVYYLKNFSHLVDQFSFSA